MLVDLAFTTAFCVNIGSVKVYLCIYIFYYCAVLYIKM